ncbi:MAG: hypothetical protein PHG23_03005 [Candidatus Pacebacteria bacterium]|nr:hypothetical protein [Candidatus Paceibacterota bacterium]
MQISADYEDVLFKIVGDIENGSKVRTEEAVRCLQELTSMGDMAACETIANKVLGRRLTKWEIAKINLNKKLRNAKEQGKPAFSLKLLKIILR